MHIFIDDIAIGIDMQALAGDPGDPASSLPTVISLQVIRNRRKTAASHATSLQFNFELYIDLYIMYNIYYIYVATLLKN